VHRGKFLVPQAPLFARRSSFVWADVFTLLLGTVNKSLSGPKCHLRNRRAEARSEPNSKKTIDARESVTVFVLDLDLVGCDNNNNKGKNDRVSRKISPEWLAFSPLCEGALQQPMKRNPPNWPK
jgi:hypothetical protein